MAQLPRNVRTKSPRSVKVHPSPSIPPAAPSAPG